MYITTFSERLPHLRRFEVPDCSHQIVRIQDNRSCQMKSEQTIKAHGNRILRLNVVRELQQVAPAIVGSPGSLSSSSRTVRICAEPGRCLCTDCVEDVEPPGKKGGISLCNYQEQLPNEYRDRSLKRVIPEGRADRGRGGSLSAAGCLCVRRIG